MLIDWQLNHNPLTNEMARVFEFKYIINFYYKKMRKGYRK
jgi:hypothetical protein